MNDAGHNVAVQWPRSLGTGTAFLDPSVESPDAQFDYLTAIIETADAQAPAPNTITPPYGETIEPDEYVPDAVLDENYLVAADVEAAAQVDLESVIDDAFPDDIPERLWENDDQYHGLGVPPGIENLDQPYESGHTQIILPDPSAEHGWDAWSGRPRLARVARMENQFRGYSSGVHRRFGDYPVEKLVVPLAWQTQQYRDLLLVELKKRGLHGYVIADVPSVPYTEEVQAIDPTVLTPEAPIGPEGVLP